MHGQPQWSPSPQEPSGPQAQNFAGPPQAPAPAQPRAEVPQNPFESRLNAVESRQALRGYSMIYAPMLLLVPFFLFVPFYTSDPAEDVTINYFMLWEMAANGFGIGIIAILFMGVLSVLLGIGVFRPGTPAVPSGIAVICLILFLLLALKIEAGPLAMYSAAGYGAMILGLAGVVTGVANELHAAIRKLTRSRR